MKSVVSRWSKAVAVALLLLLQLLPATPALAQGGDWTTKTLMPAARAWAAAGVINGVLYVAGGHDGTTGGTTTLQAYNPATDTWSTLVPMPGRRYQGDGAGVINGELYMAGGWNYPDNSIPQSQLFVYNPGANAWSSKAAMPTLSGNGASGAINGKLYVTTAANGYSGWRNFLHVYDPANDTWTSLASSPNDHVNPAFGVIDNKFYVAGGDSDSGVHAMLDVYDPDTSNWTTKASMPVAGQNFASGVINGKLYAIGGDIAGAYSNTVYVYDPSTDTWTTETPMPTARAGAVAGVINGVLYVVGGSNGTGTLATAEAFVASLSTNTYTITASAGVNGAISPSGAVTVDQGASQAFTISANSGYSIAGVIVDGSSVGAVTTYTFTNVTANHSITASFAINTYTLTYTAGTNGTITGTSPQTVNYGASGTQVTAVPNTGYTFVQWSDGVTTAARTDTNVTANINVTASFAINTFTPTSTPTPSTTPTSSSGGGRSMPDPSTYVMIGSGLAVALLYVGILRLRRRLNRSR